MNSFNVKKHIEFEQSMEKLLSENFCVKHVKTYYKFILSSKTRVRLKRRNLRIVAGLE